MIETIIQAPLVAVMMMPWLIVVYPAIFALLLFQASNREWKGYAITTAVVAIGIAGWALWPRDFGHNQGPALVEDEIYLTMTNFGLIILLALALLASSMIALARWRSKTSSKEQFE